MTQTIFARIAIAKSRLDQIRPLSGEALRQLDEWYDVNFTYTSNALEGNTLTRNETAIVIEKGITVRGKPLKDHNEAVDHYAAVKFMRDLAKDGCAFTEADIKQLHQMAVSRTLSSAGRYAAGDRFITTSQGMRAFPPAHDVPILMQQFIGNLPDELSPHAAFMAHLDLVTIHPFDDGNGRTARLFMNAILLRGGYPPVMVDPADRPDYIDAIEAFQTGGTPDLFLSFMGSQLLITIDNHIARITGDVPDPKQNADPSKSQSNDPKPK
ncbi:MAG: Fic family protein [Alphaproteobacteria bacterium]|nr:Fic family protein [Alphaproteobacteria bacterium]